jgi:hypothetical protein
VKSIAIISSLILIGLNGFGQNSNIDVQGEWVYCDSTTYYFLNFFSDKKCIYISEDNSDVLNLDAYYFVNNDTISIVDLNLNETSVVFVYEKGNITPIANNIGKQIKRKPLSKIITELNANDCIRERKKKKRLQE